MKYLVLFLYLFLAIISYAEDTGRIEVVGSDTIDFGKYPAWERKVATYTIRNSGEGTLKILKIRKTCGCASANIDKNELKPKETAVLEVVILPYSIFNLYSKNTFVESTDPNNRFLQLNVAGNAIPLVEITPKAEFYAGRIKTGQSWSQSFNLEPTEPGVILGKPDIKSNYPVEAQLNKADKSGQYSLSVNLIPTSNSGDLKCLINIPIVTSLALQAK